MTDARLTVADLSADQHEAYAGITTWLNRGTATKQTLSMGGFGGTGKSTVVSVLAHELLKLGPIAFATYTGKASSVLGRKLRASGIDTMSRIPGRKALEAMGGFNPKPYCGTIHGLIYAPCDVCMVEQVYDHNYGKKCTAEGALGMVVEEGHEDEAEKAQEMMGRHTDDVCLACNPPPPVKKEGPCHKCHGERFFRQSGLDRGYKLLITDESSMISDDILRDLLSYRVPILAVGDHGQLPPIKGVGSLMKYPDLRLEKIHRQAEGNPIIALAARVRETGNIDDSLHDGNMVSIISRRDFDRWLPGRFTPERLNIDPSLPEGILGTVVVSWTNKQRIALNDQIRNCLGISDQPPKKGEVMICLKNKAPIYNGMRGVLEYDAVSAGTEELPKWKTSVNFVEDGQRAENLLMADAQIFAEKTIDYETAQEMGVSFSRLGDLYDFGYALTCHKMQGSQAPEVAVLVDGMRAMDKATRNAWAYTAFSRAAERLVVVR